MGPTAVKMPSLKRRIVDIHRVLALVAPQAVGQGMFAGASPQNRDILVLADRRADAAQQMACLQSNSKSKWLDVSCAGLNVRGEDKVVGSLLHRSLGKSACP